MARGPFRMRVSGGRATQRRFAAMPNDLRGQAVRILVRGGELLAGRARRRVAADLNALRGSIAARPPRTVGHRISVEVGTNKQHGMFVEFGTGPAGGRSTFDKVAKDLMAELGYQHGAHGGFPPLDVITAWARRKGFPDPEAAAFFIRRRIRIHGTPARPYLGPAFTETAPTIIVELQLLLRRFGARGGKP